MISVALEDTRKTEVIFVYSFKIRVTANYSQKDGKNSFLKIMRTFLSLQGQPEEQVYKLFLLKCYRHLREIQAIKN
jgi:hypothetical protein